MHCVLMLQVAGDTSQAHRRPGHLCEPAGSPLVNDSIEWIMDPPNTDLGRSMPRNDNSSKKCSKSLRNNTCRFVLMLDEMASIFQVCQSFLPNDRSRAVIVGIVLAALAAILHWSRTSANHPPVLQHFPVVALTERALGPKQSWRQASNETLAKGLKVYPGPFQILTGTGPKVCDSYILLLSAADNGLPS